MNADYVEQTTALICRIDGQELLPHAVRLLADGEPVAVAQLATAAGWPVEDVESALRAQTSAERDDHGRLVGLALTLRPTTHHVTVGGRTLFAWCASDTLMLPVILGRPVVVQSTCPQSGRAIRVELTPDSVERVEPPDAVVSSVRPASQLTDVRSTTCAHGHFFSSIEATAAWAGAHPDGHIHPVADAFRLDRQVTTHLGWNAA
jgi:alkylmercury lyase